MLRIVEERKKRGWSQTFVALECRIHPGNLSKIENGKLYAYPGYRKKLENFFGIPADDLFEEVQQQDG